MSPAILFQATRAWSAPGSAIPALLGTALAARGYACGGHGAFNGLSLVLVVVGAVLANFGANVFNDYFDFVQGVDTKPEHGSGVLTGGLMTPRQALGFGAALFGVAAACGAFFLRRDAAIVVPLALIGFACAVLYPACLKKYALGDVLLTVGFGGCVTLGAYAVQVHSLSVHQGLLVVLYAVPLALLLDSALHAGNLQNGPDDQAAGVRTVANLLPLSAGMAVYGVLLFGPLVFVVLGVLLRFLPLWSLLSLLPAPLLVKAYRTINYHFIFQAHLVFGVLYTASLLLA
jgi:1,4-dihydroxy-2-naphthoate octaprenyltransferase